MSSLEIVVNKIREATDEYAVDLPPDGDWEPMLFVFKGDKVSIVPLPMPPNGRLRELFFQSFLPSKLKAMEPDMVVMLVSTWFLSLENQEGRDMSRLEDLPTPSESPDRREAVLIQAVSRDEEITHMAEIIRREDEHPELEWKDLPVGGEGRMIAALRRGVWG